MSLPFNSTLPGCIEAFDVRSAKMRTLCGLLSYALSWQPISDRQNWPYPINSVFNAGAVRLPGGDTLLLCRVEDRTGLSHLCAARSENGIDGMAIDANLL